MVDTIIDPTDINPVLNDIMLAELAGVIRYTHYSLVITGPNRLPLVAFMMAQADESLLHARLHPHPSWGNGGLAHVLELHGPIPDGPTRTTHVSDSSSACSMAG